MGLYQSPAEAEGMLPVMVLNMILCIVTLRDLIKSVLRFLGVVKECSSNGGVGEGRKVLITRFESTTAGNDVSNECCCSVCLCGFEYGEFLSELSCKHFFHRGCLEKWFCNNGGNDSCPLCRSVM